jgi:hypothetical protein
MVSVSSASSMLISVIIFSFSNLMYSIENFYYILIFYGIGINIFMQHLSKQHSCCNASHFKVAFSSKIGCVPVNPNDLISIKSF